MAKPDGCDTAFTEAVVAATGDKADPRLKEVMSSMIRHLHDFAREVDLTVDEWALGVDFINQCGQMSSGVRNETQLLCDVLGLESLVDAITQRQRALSPTAVNTTTTSPSLPYTPSTVLGPFYRPDAPILAPSSSIIAPSNRDAYLSSTAHVSGRVLSAAGDPVPRAVLDVWHTAPNGMYEQQDPAQPDMDLRGRFQTDARGAYALYCLRPVAYPVPGDGPAGRLLRRLDRPALRPAHVHFIVSAPGFRPLTTQLFDADDPWLADDAVFAVKRELVVRFEERAGDAAAGLQAVFDFVLMEDGGAADRPSSRQ